MTLSPKNTTTKRILPGVTFADDSVAIIADPHIGPRKVRGLSSEVVESVVLESLRSAFYLVGNSGIKHLVIIGDVFDRVVVPPKYVHAVDVLASSYRNKFKTYFVAGNHDIGSGDSALLYLTSGVNVTDRHQVGRVVCVAFRRGVAAENAIEEALAVSEEATTVAFHYGVSFGDVPWLESDKSFISAARLAEICLDYDVKFAVGGHRHTHGFVIIDGVRIYSLGALSPRSVVEKGVAFGNIFVTHSGAPEKHLAVGVVPGIRFVDKSDVHSSALSGCWSVVLDDDGFSDSPDSAIAALGARTSLAKKAVSGRTVAAPVASLQDAIVQAACARAASDRCLSGPFRLVSNALGKLTGINSGGIAERPEEFDEW